MFDASLMPEDIRPSTIFDKEVLLNLAESSRREEPAKKYLPIANSDKVRRRRLRKQDAKDKAELAEDTEPTPIKVPRELRTRHGMYRH